MTPVYTSAQIRLIEKYAIKSGVSGKSLMARAGAAAFEQLALHWPHSKSIAVLVGGGNNGGDGLVLARLALEKGLQCTLYTLGDLNSLKNEALDAWQELKAFSPAVKPIKQLKPNHYDLIVDALFGIGFKSDVDSSLQGLFESINESITPVLAIDIPSGLCADRGIAEPIAIKADTTITFIALKSGLLTAQASEYCGDIHVEQLNIDKALFSHITPPIHAVRSLDFVDHLKPRKHYTHKHAQGHVLIIGGDRGMNGAVTLAAKAALRTGAGLVSVATHPSHAALINLTQPEIMAHGIEKAKDLKPLLEKASVLLIGPGLGQSDWSKSLWRSIQKCKDKPKVVDADGLRFLSQSSERTDNWVLTPHPGEAASLCGETTQNVQSQRWKIATQLQNRYGGVCVLKGSGTIIADGEQQTVCTAGNPGMASAGMGDVLAGIIASFIGQGLSLSDAANLAVCLHAETGDELAKQHGERGLLASDLLTTLQHKVNRR